MKRLYIFSTCMISILIGLFAAAQAFCYFKLFQAGWPWWGIGIIATVVCIIFLLIIGLIGLLTGSDEPDVKGPSQPAV